MSTRQIGNRKENAVIAALEIRGYWCFPSRGSRGIDIIALAPQDSLMPHFAIECGAESKRLGVTFAKHKDVSLFPGMVFAVARVLTRKRRKVLWWYPSADERYTTLDDFLEALQS